jgi:hypothetical protein
MSVGIAQGNAHHEAEVSYAVRLVGVGGSLKWTGMCSIEQIDQREHVEIQATYRFILWLYII